VFSDSSVTFDCGAGCRALPGAPFNYLLSGSAAPSAQGDLRAFGPSTTSEPAVAS